jgi:hypothetical protein
MASQLELNSRAALCRQLAKREPANQALWMAEAENWSRLSKEKLRGEAGAKIGEGAASRPFALRQCGATHRHLEGSVAFHNVVTSPLNAVHRTPRHSAS